MLAADLEEARQLLNGQRIQYFMINDQIKTFPEPSIACTLHPDKLNGHFAWLRIRRKANFRNRRGLVASQAWGGDARHRKH